MINQQLLEKIKKASKFEYPEDAKVFDEGVWDIIKTNNIDLINILFRLFDDNTKHPEVMFSLVHALESLPDDIYFESLLDACLIGQNNFSGWLNVLLFRILNDNKSFNSFKKKLDKIRHKKSIETITSILSTMRAESPDHVILIRELEQLLDQNNEAI